jgi:branched-chain amino acid transport system permease protein
MLIRAGASNCEMVSALGVNIQLLYAFVFGVGAALAGLAGLIEAPILTAQIGMGENILNIALVPSSSGPRFDLGRLHGGDFRRPRRYRRVRLRARIVPPGDDTGRGIRTRPALSSMPIYLLMAVVLAPRPQGLFPVDGK